MSEALCKNCHNTLPEKAAYCPVCGQSTRTITRPWLEAFRELIAEVFDLDGRMMNSLRLLLTRPGLLSYEYIHGRRVSHTSPLRMYLIISLGFFLLLPFMTPIPVERSASHEFSPETYSKAMFVLLPLFALFLKGLYRNFYYLAHLVFSMYLFSAIYIGFSWMLLLESWSDRHVAALGLQVLVFILLVVYTVKSLRTAYSESWVKSALKFLVLLGVFLPIIAVALDLASHLASIRF